MFYVLVKDEKVLEYRSLELLKKIHGENAQYQTFTREQLAEVGKRIKGSAYFYPYGDNVIVRDSEEHDTVIDTLIVLQGIDSQLEHIDRSFGDRANRGLMRKMAKKNGIAPEDYDLKKLDEAETRADGLREKRAALRKKIGFK